MSLLDTIKDLFGGASDHIQSATDAVQGLADNEAVQGIKDKATDLGGQAEETLGGAGEQAQGVVDEVKNKLGL